MTVTKEKPGRGGARPGSGRKTSSIGELQLTAVRLDQTTREAAKRLGGGNMAEGIRIAVTRCIKSEIA
jgi:hypothetical protein